MSSFIDIKRPVNQAFAVMHNAFWVLGGSLFLAFMSQLSLPLWFTPVPISMQTFAVMLLGGVLGGKKGGLAVLFYLFEGAIGFPCFANHRCGPTVLFGPTGGYLFGFVLSAFLIGFLMEKGWKKSYKLTLAALLSGTVVVFASGTIWLSYFVGTESVLAMGVYPFMVGEILKILAAAVFIPFGWKAMNYLK